MKALIGDSDDRILGFMMIGAAADEVMPRFKRQCWQALHIRALLMRRAPDDG